ncbi:MAG: AAA family ATPase, partial [Ilumatobacteraceae bacterium]
MAGPSGREAECEIAATFLAAAVAGPAALEIDGEAGIGKTTLFRHTVSAARDAGFRVLACGLTDAESALSFAGLTDLLRDVEPTGIARLTPPQRHALEVSTLRCEPAESPVDERAIGTGLASLIDLLSVEGPMIIAIDDAQWLDRSTANVLAFALRRLGGQPLGLLRCRRSGLDDQGMTARLRDPTWTHSIRLRGMTAAGVFHVVLSQRGIVLTRPMLLRITEASQGNPFVALELVRAVASVPGNSSDALPLPESLQSMMTGRLATLSVAAQDSLVAVACAGRPAVALLASLGLGAGLDEAEAARVVSISDDRVAFDHPLLSSAVLLAASAPSVRAVHARLAEGTTDPEARARHLALARPHRDAATSAALDAAALSAEARGSTIAAAELARLALDRTPDGDADAEWSRRLRLAHLLHATGSESEAADVVADVDRSCPAGLVRAGVHLMLAEVTYQVATADRALAHATAALVDAGNDPSLRARALLTMAVLTTDAETRAEHAEEAKRCLVKAKVTDPLLVGWATSEEVSARFNLGLGLDASAMDDALTIERTGRDWRSGDQVAALRPVLLKWADHHSEALA